MALHGSDRAERKRQERRAQERAARFEALERQLTSLEERVMALPDDMGLLMRIAAITAELRLLPRDAIAAREEAIARVAAVVTEAEGKPVVRGRQARYDRSQLPVRGGLPRPIRGRRGEP